MAKGGVPLSPSSRNATGCHKSADTTGGLGDRTNSPVTDPATMTRPAGSVATAVAIPWAVLAGFGTTSTCVPVPLNVLSGLRSSGVSRATPRPCTLSGGDAGRGAMPASTTRPAGSSAAAVEYAVPPKSTVPAAAPARVAGSSRTAAMSSYVPPAAWVSRTDPVRNTRPAGSVRMPVP